jgi:hypothetical protein
MVFAADKISKARELALDAAGTGSLGQPARPNSTRGRDLAHYGDCLRLVEQLLTDSQLVIQLRTELDKLPAVPAVEPQLAGSARP